VTHPDMERFFMTIPEASRLVLEAAGLCEGGEVMVLDMGDPIRIVTLAEQMIRLSGFEPRVDIDIVFTGVRPGEKLTEELVQDGESLEPTGVEKIYRWICETPPVSMGAALELLGRPSADPDEIRARLATALPEYRGLDLRSSMPRRSPARRPPAFEPARPRVVPDPVKAPRHTGR